MSKFFIPPDRSRGLSDAPGTLIDHLLPLVEKPARYVGGEVNMVRKDPSRVRVRMALAFPDAYEVGMSHLGLKILYGIVNAHPDFAAERVFAVWPDLEALMRAEGLPLASLETATPLREFDLVGFSLQYELCATNVLQMLDLGGIPLRAADRGQGDPFVVAGGPAAFNPLPLGPFFDAFALGDGEELIIELAEMLARWRSEGGSRGDLLSEWKKLEGVYVPSLHKPGQAVKRRVVADIERAWFPTKLVVPFCETVHDRVGVEIARGCTRGCRFCQAGMLYRPVREREAGSIVDIAARSLRRTGWEEVSLLSLSSGDYTGAADLVAAMTERFCDDKVALSLPSLRTETFDARMAEQIRRVRKTGFTLAPEAGTERLRKVINKGNTEEDLQRAIAAAFAAGWQGVKLYFMIGLPTETEEDVDAIVGLIRKAARWADRGAIRASISTFVPKTHTPFQWAGQIDPDETRRRQQQIRRRFQKGHTRVKVHDARISFLEGVLARGDGRLAEVIEHAFRKGARFEGWEEWLRPDVWSVSFDECGVDPHEYLKPRSVSGSLPWDFIATGVTKDFLGEEWRRAQREETTLDCRVAGCQDCGVCDFERLYPRVAEPPSIATREAARSEVTVSEEGVRRFVLRYAKTGPMRFLGHRDLIRMFHRAFRRGGLQLAYSQGFHPHPKLRFSPPLPVGVESLAEYLEFDLVQCDGDPAAVRHRLAGVLPFGISVHQCAEIPLNSPPVSGKIQQVTYEIRSFGSLLSADVDARVRDFENSPSFPMSAERKGMVRTRDLKQIVERLTLVDSTLIMAVRADASGSVNPIHAAAAVLGVSRTEARSLRIVKTSTSLAASPGDHEHSIDE